MRVICVAIIGGLVACGHHGADPDASPADAPPWAPDAPLPDAPPGTPDATPIDAGPPQTLLETGLCANAACDQINSGIYAFTPRWPLWSDGATKKRWIYLPPGTQIDTSDMDWWHFPQGTKLWKEFTRDGIRVETRMYWKQGATDDTWFQMAYVWNATQDDAVATPLGQMNANGTQHDVPARSDCRKCHDRNPQGGRILGFSALQLDVPAKSSEIALDDIVKMGWLSKPPASNGSIGGPYFPLWPDRTPEAEAALGYMHANCGQCHNEPSDVFQVCPRIFHLSVAELTSVHDTKTYITTIKQTPSITVANGTYVVAPGDPDHSALYIHFTGANGAERMPPLATEIIDPTGQAALKAWIQQVPAN